MLKISELKPYKGATKRRKVVGRGLGSGHGTYSGRGIKGQKARSGGKIPVGFEGGNMPLQRLLPKRRGFTSRATKSIAIDFKTLTDKFKANDTINPKTLFNKNLIKSLDIPVKIVGDGELARSFTFEKVSLTATAKEKIEKAGGKINE